MYILGLAFGFHDASAALLSDGEVVAAALEERFTRRKHDPDLPRRAIDYVLSEGRITSADLDTVVLHESAPKKFDRVVHSAASNLPAGAAYLEKTVRSWMAHGKFDVRRRVADAVGVPLDRIHSVEHHAAHAASAYFASAFDSATVVTMDGVGEYEAATVWTGRGSRLEKLYSMNIPHSLGLFYSAFTAFLGFEVNEGEYKVMGMAGFGDPRSVDRIVPLLRLEDDGMLSLDTGYFEFLTPEDRPYTSRLTDLLGPARTPDSPFSVGDRQRPASSDLETTSRHYADLAASVQSVVEQAIFHVVESAVRRTGLPDVCLAGGVALNSLANGKLQRRMSGRLYVQPAAGDAGTSLGAALFYAHAERALPRRGALTTAFLGPDYGQDDVDAALRRGSVRRSHRFEEEDELLRTVARRLAEGAVVGVCRGRFEWGPRALGARSILANPTIPEMQRLVNEKIKFREPFRPFAPAVLDDRAREFFDLLPPFGLESPDYFMISVANVHAAKRRVIPAVTHVDGTARVQLVSRATNPWFHRLIACFDELTGVPVVLNTSFNLRGEPIVASPWDALWTFGWSGMDVLVLGNVLIEKSELS
ncbi:MAG TPA: carbamoyltransferase C-terminal domain-containing protein [Vicinamibacterales bacterium]